MCNGVKPLYRTEEGVHHRELKFSRFYDEHDVCFFLSGLQWYVFVGLSAIVRKLRPCCTQLKMRMLQPFCRDLATTCYNKLISGCVRMACDSLLTTSLLQVVNRLVASIFSKLFINKLDLLQVVSTSCNKCANDKMQQA